MRTRFDLLNILFFLILFSGFAAYAKQNIANKAPLKDVKKQLEALAPVTLTSNLTHLPVNEIKVIKLLVEASKIMDDIFLTQVYEYNPGIYKELKESTDPDDKIYLTLFKSMFGPWNRLKANQPFINSALKPKGANYYPAGMTKTEFIEWLKAHPEDREAFESNFTMIRRKGKKLVAIPYSKYFRESLVKASDLLNKAAAITSDPTLKTFLNSRASAFLSNDYYYSDMDWMDLDGDIEVVIGPYEVYEDALMGYKAAFESFVCVVDHEESKKLGRIGKYLYDMENNLPIPDKYKNFERGTSSPFKVVNEIFAGGDTKAGAQTLAFNLPNDERVREDKGSKKVMLKNVMKAKYEKIYLPIVEKILASKDLKRVSFDGYFNHILMHEVSHGLGPGKITVNGRKSTVNKELKELYSTIEECKADLLGVYNAQFLIDEGVLPKELENTLYASNFGGMFRSIRFGLGKAHGGGVAIQLNYYMDRGAITVDEDGNFSVNDEKMKKACAELSGELLLIQAKGDYEGAKKLIKQYKVLRPEVKTALEKVKDVPVDIRPIYSIEEDI